MTKKLPTLPHPAYYIAECCYSWGGENHINILVKTDIDVHKLLKTDLRGYLEFIQDSLADHFDFANYEDDSEVFSIADFEREKGESREDFFSRVITLITHKELQNIHDGGALNFSINAAKPSTLDGFRRISDEDAAVLENHMPQAQIIPLV